MNYAEGKGPRQIKSTYVTGKFVTLYGNGDVNNYNPATVPYPTQLSGAVPGGVAPGLNIKVNGNNSLIDVGAVCSPSPGLSVQDMETLFVDFWLNPTFSGQVYLELQGSNNRFVNSTVYPAAQWITILTGTASGTAAGVTATLNNTSTVQEYPKLAYRVIASGYTGASGIIDWAIPGLFVDYYAMGIGANAADANGGIGQMSIQGPRGYTIQSGQYITTDIDTVPLENTKANHTWIG